MPYLRSVLGVVIKLADADKREPEISEALQQTEQFPLISNPAHEYRVPVVARHGHALEFRSDLVVQFTFGFEPIRYGMHQNTLAHSPAG